MRISKVIGMMTLRKMSAVAMALPILLLSACGGGGHSQSSALPAVQSNAQTRSAMFLSPSEPVSDLPYSLHGVGRGQDRPEPFVESAGYVPRHVDLPRVARPFAVDVAKHLEAVQKFMAAGSRRADSTVTVRDGGGQGGLYWQPAAAGNGSYWVAQDAVPPIANGNAVYLSSPANCDKPDDNVCGNFLYAPTTHGGAGNCIETTSEYSNIVGQSTAGTTYYNLMITNFCTASPSFIQLPMNTDFFDNYVRVYSNADGRPQYCIEVLLESDGQWHVLIYNNLLQKYDDLYDTGGSTQVAGGLGWSMFETHYAYNETGPGTTSVACATTPNIGASGVRVLVNGTFQEIGSNAALQVRGTPSQCFSYDGTSPDYYIPSLATDINGNSNDSAWVVVDPVDGRNPTTQGIQAGGGTGGTGGGSTGGNGGGGTVRCGKVFCN